MTYTLGLGDFPGPLTNTVTVSGEAAAGPPITTAAMATAAVGVASAADIAAFKVASVITTEVGQTITYTYRVSNTGSITLTGVTGTDDKLGTVTFDPTTLSPGRSASGTLAYAVRLGDWPGPIRNTVIVTGIASGLPLTATAEAMATVELVGPADIRVLKTANVITAEAGQTITYTYRVTNSGSVTLVAVSGWDDKLGAVPFGHDVLDPDQHTTGVLTYAVQVGDLPGPLANTVDVTGTAAAGPPLIAMASDAAAVDLRGGRYVYLPMLAKLVP
jgi:hypothetical protein